MEDRIETGRGIVGIIEMHNSHYPVFNLRDSSGRPNIRPDCVEDFEPVYISSNCEFPNFILPFVSSRIDGRLNHYGVYGDNTIGVRIHTKRNDNKKQKDYDLSKVFRLVNNNRVYIFDKKHGNFKLKIEFLCSVCYTLDEYFDIVYGIKKRRIR